MVAGLTLASAEEMLERIPGLLLLVPAAIDMRGNIYGALASRLSTALHTGEYDAGLRRGGFMGRQVEASSLLAVGTSVIIAVLAWTAGTLVGLEPVPVWHLVVIATVGGGLASVALLVVTVALSLVARRREWNLDDVGAPTVTVFGDILTVPALLLAALIVDYETMSLVLGLALAAAGAACLVAGWIHREDGVRRIVRESVPALAAAAGVGAIAGTILEGRLEQWVAAPFLLVMIPSFVANCGSLGGILSSRLASKLHLGLVEARLWPGRQATLDISVAFFFAVFAFTAIGLSAWASSLVFGFAPPPVGIVVALALLAGLLSTVILSVVAYAVAAASYAWGLDPDNEGIPIVTSVMDLMGLVVLVGVAATVWGL